MLIRNKFNGYSRDGSRVYPSGGPGTSTSYTSNIPEYLQPYAETMLGATQKQLFNIDDKGEVTGFRPFAPYGAAVDDQGNILNTAQDQAKAAVAGFSPLQQQAQSGIANFTMPGQTAAASKMTADLAGRALKAGEYDATSFGNQFNAPDKYSGVNFTNQFTAPDKYANTTFSYDKVSPTDQLGGTMTAAQMTAPTNVSGFGGATKEASTQSFTDPGTASSYMSPYTQGVTNIQTREAERAANVANTQLGAQAAQQGAFGGSRHAIMQAEAARNLATQKGDITAKGQQEAYQQAAQQFNAEQGYGLTAQQANLQAGLQSALANQQAGLTAGTQNLSASQQANVQNLAAKLQTQGLNAQQAMQAALANQQAGISTQQASEQSKQFGYGQEMTAAQQRAQYGLAAQQAQEQSNQFGYGQQMNAAQQRAQYGLAAQQASEQSKQYGAGLGMQGVGLSGQMASQLGGLGQQEYGQKMGILGAQAQAGGQQQQLEQARINQAMQNYATQQQYPLMQLGVMSNMLRGLPMQASTTNAYAAQPSAASQFAGALGTGMQVSNQAKQYGLMGAEGGEVKNGRFKSMAAGGIATGVDPEEMPYIAKKMGDQQIGQKLGDPATDNETKSYLQAEADFRKQARSNSMAAGGVIAFRKGSEEAVGVNDPYQIDKISSALEARGAKTPAAPVVAKTDVPPVTKATAGDEFSDMRAPVDTAVTQGGIAQAVIPELKATDAETKLTKQLGARETEANKTLEQRLQEQTVQKKKFGIDPSFLQDAIDKQEKRKTDLQGEAKDEAMNRFAEFLMTWGSTPGPTMVAAAKAGREYIANTNLDKKERKRLLAEADGVITDLNKSIYLEKSGSFKDAQAEQIRAGEVLFSLTNKLADLQGARTSTQFKETSATIRDTITANAAMARTMAQMKSEEDRATAKGILEKELKNLEVNKHTDYMNGVAINYNALVAGGDKPGAATIAKASSQYLKESKQYDVRALTAEASQTQAAAAQDETKRKLSETFNRAIFAATSFDEVGAARMAKARAADNKARVEIADPNSETNKVLNAIKAEIYAKPEFELIRPAAAKPAAPPAPAAVAAPAAPAAAAKPAANPDLSDESALNWAKSNPDDPRSALILKKAGAK